jgi:hypothetical protein
MRSENFEMRNDELKGLDAFALAAVTLMGVEGPICQSDGTVGRVGILPTYHEENRGNQECLSVPDGTLRMWKSECRMRNADCRRQVGPEVGMGLQNAK